MRPSNQSVLPPCCMGTEISYQNGRRQLRKASSGLGFLLFCCAMTSLTTTKLFSLFLRAMGYHGSLLYSGYANLEPSLYYLLLGAAFTLSMLVPGLLYLAVTRMPLGQALPSKKIAPDIWIALFFLGSALALLSNLPVNWISDWISSLLPQTESMPYTEAIPMYNVTTVASTILYVIRSTVLPAFFEEFLFRGILLGQLRRYGNGFAVVLSAALFGMFHGNLKQACFAFLVGLIFGYIVVRTNHIWITVAAHFFNNAFATFPDVFRTLLPNSTYALLYNVIYYGMLVMGAFAALWLLYRWREFFFSNTPSRKPISLPSRLFAWISAPGTLLIIAYCAVETFTPWI